MDTHLLSLTFLSASPILLSLHLYNLLEESVSLCNQNHPCFTLQGSNQKENICTLLFICPQSLEWRVNYWKASGGLKSCRSEHWLDWWHLWKCPAKHIHKPSHWCLLLPDCRGTDLQTGFSISKVPLFPSENPKTPKLAHTVSISTESVA